MEKKTEVVKQKAYYFVDFIIGAFVFGVFIAFVALSANGIINVFTRWFPKLKKQS